MAFVLLSLVLVVALVLHYRQGRARRFCRVVAKAVAAAAVTSVGCLQLPAARGAWSGESGKADASAASALFGRLCQRCHGPDGKGDRGGGVRGLPDFTNPSWHEGVTDAKLAVSIREGKGTGMPAFNDRLSADQADALVVHLRAFAPLRSRAGIKGPSLPGAPASVFQARFQELEKEFEELQTQLVQTRASQDGPARVPAPGADGPSARGGPAASPATLFRRHCQGCHGPDGGGNQDRYDTADLPDFRRRSWHRLRSDAQLAAAVLDGGGAMPPFRRRLSEADVRGLVTHLRGFAAAAPAVPRPSPRPGGGGAASGEIRGGRAAPEGMTAPATSHPDPGRSGGRPRLPASRRRGPLFTRQIALTGRVPLSR